MELQTAIDLIRPGVIPASGTWADLGAGTGLFTEALFAILQSGKVIAMDKSPHALYALKPPPHVSFEILEGDFTKTLPLPEVDGILMANALHYAPDHVAVLQNVLKHLRPGGTFLLIEYDTDKANPPWVPYPLSQQRAEMLFSDVGLKNVHIVGKQSSIYEDGGMYILAATF